MKFLAIVSETYGIKISRKFLRKFEEVPKKNDYDDRDCEFDSTIIPLLEPNCELSRLLMAVASPEETEEGLSMPKN